MSVRRLKSSKSEIQKKEDDITVKTMVEATLQHVEKRGDKAVRELSLKFDKYNPQSFLLSASEIDAAIQKVSNREMNDIKFAKEKTRSLGVKDTFTKNLLSSTRQRMENARKKFQKKN